MNPLISGFGVAPADNGAFVVSIGGENLVFVDAWSLVQWLESARDDLIAKTVASVTTSRRLH